MSFAIYKPARMMSFMDTTRVRLNFFLSFFSFSRGSKKDIVGCFMAQTKYSVTGWPKAKRAQMTVKSLWVCPEFFPGLLADALSFLESWLTGL